MLFLPHYLSFFSIWLTQWAYQRNRERGKQNLLCRAKNFSFKVMEQESPTVEKSGACLRGISCPITFSAFNSVLSSNQHNLAFQGELPLEKIPALQMKSERAKKHHSPHPRPVKPLWLLLTSSHLTVSRSCHSYLFTQSLPLSLSLQVMRAKLLSLTLNTAAAKSNFVHSLWKFWSSSTRNKAHGNHVYISFQLEGSV